MRLPAQGFSYFYRYRDIGLGFLLINICRKKLNLSGEFYLLKQIRIMYYLTHK